MRRSAAIFSFLILTGCAGQSALVAPRLSAGTLGVCLFLLDSDIRIWVGTGQQSLPSMRRSRLISAQATQYLARLFEERGYRVLEASSDIGVMASVKEHLLLYEQVAGQAYDNLSKPYSPWHHRRLGTHYGIGAGLATLGSPTCAMATVVRGYQAQAMQKPSARLSLGVLRLSDGLLLWLNAIDGAKFDLTNHADLDVALRRLLNGFPASG